MPTIVPRILTNAERSIAVSIGWPTLRAFDARTGETRHWELAARGELLACGRDAFAILSHVPGPTFSIRTFDEPGLVMAIAELIDDRLVVRSGDDSWLAALPKLVPLGLNRCLHHDGGEFHVRALADQLPDWATDGESFPYAAACPDGVRVVMCGYRYGQELVVWNSLTGEIDARVPLLGHGVMGGAFRPGHDELWIAELDTIVRVDTRKWEIADAKRVRNEPTGSFVAAFAFDGDGRRLAAAHSLRRFQPLQVPGGTVVPWYAPSGHELLVIDADRFAVTHVAHHGAWLDGLAWLTDDKVLAIEWRDPYPFVSLRPSTASRELHPPRPPGSWDWR